MKTDKKKENSITKFSEASKDISFVICELIRLSRSFEAVGNTYMSDKLYDLKVMLEDSQETVDQIFSEESYQRYRAAQQSSFNVLSATVAGLEIGLSAQKEKQNDLPKEV